MDRKEIYSARIYHGFGYKFSKNGCFPRIFMEIPPSPFPELPLDKYIKCYIIPSEAKYYG
jgi:hypothetical protein